MEALVRSTKAIFEKNNQAKRVKTSELEFERNSKLERVKSGLMGQEQ